MVFEEQRPRLFGLAYRLLGSAEEAEDLVQDTYLRWTAADQALVQNPQAWLTKVLTNLCLTRLTSARARREQYVGTWLPEPVLTSGGPLELAEQRETVSFALLVLLEQLTPPERAVFVLHEAFDYSHREIAEIIGQSEVNCRQLLRRARTRIMIPAQTRSPDDHELVRRFFAAANKGDLESLENLLAADVTVWGDGGGKATAARRPVVGAPKVARYFSGLLTNFGADVDITFAEVNGSPAILGWGGPVLLGVMVAQIADGVIANFHVTTNPDKLGFITRQAK